MPLDLESLKAQLKATKPPAQGPEYAPPPAGGGYNSGSLDLDTLKTRLRAAAPSPPASPEPQQQFKQPQPKPQTPPMSAQVGAAPKAPEYNLTGPKQPLPKEVSAGMTFASQKAGQLLNRVYEGIDVATQAKQAVAEAGQGKYVEVKGLGDILHNVGQWNPFGFGGAGKALTALGQGATVLGEAALVGADIANTGAEGVERLIGDQYYTNVTPLRQQLGVDSNDPAQELAFQTATGITYSGPEAVKAAYKDALNLAQQGQLTPENAQIVGAKHGVWYKEAIGQILLDPLNVLDAVGGFGKNIRYADDIMEAGKVFTTSLLTKGTKEIVPVEQITKQIADLATRGGQAAQETSLIKKGLAYVAPRLQSTEAHILAERTTQIVDIAAGITVKRAAAETAQKGLTLGSDEFALEASGRAAERFQEIAHLWAETANADAKIANQAAEQLTRLGFGEVPKSFGGRVTGVVLRDMMEKPGGELGALSGALDIARSKGLSAEHAAELWYEQAVKVIEKRIPKPKFETGVAFEAAQGIKKVRQPLDSAMGTVFFGLNPGYAARNYYMNIASAALHGYLPIQLGKKLTDTVGFAVKGAEEGIGQAGSAAGSFTRHLPGYKLAQWGEKAVSRPVAEQGRMDALRTLWPKAMEQLGDIPAELRSKVRDLIYQPANVIDELAKGGVLPDEAWRHVADESLVEAIHSVDPGLYSKVTEILATAKTPENAAVALQQFLREAGGHAAGLAKASRPIGHATGTMTGQAIKVVASVIPEPQLQKLSRQLSQVEHALQQARNQAYAAAQLGTDPSRWYAMLQKVEGQYNEAVQEIMQRQLVGYARLQAGEITPELYGKALTQIYKEAQTKLFQKYAQVTTAEVQIAPRLRQMLLKMAHEAGVSSATPGGGVNPHFMNKIRKILVDAGTLPADEAGRLRDITNLTDDQMLQAINFFKRAGGVADTTLDELTQEFFGKPYAGQMSKLRGIAALPEQEAAALARLAASNNPQVKMIAAAAQQAMEAAPSPSLADGTFSATKQATQVIGDVIQHILKNSQVTPPTATPQLPEFWNKVLSLYTQTHTMAAEVGRRARNRVLLDYGDRRTFDVFAQTVFPWHYWASRNTPNWAKAIISRPTPALHYMKLRRELREYNDNDPNIPDWAKEHIVLNVPGFSGQAFWDYGAAFNGVQTIFDSFDDPSKQRDLFGQIVSSLGSVGAAPHPMLMMAYAAERGLIYGDTEGARSYGFVSPQTRTFANLTGTTLEPWLWLKDPTTGKPIPFSGGTTWDVEKGVRRLGYKQGQGEVSPEAAILGGATHAGPELQATLINDIAQQRRLPVLLSLLAGVRLSMRGEWENEIADINGQYSALKDAGKDSEANELLAQNPWLSTVWMSWDNEAARMKMLANNVLNRIPPMKGDDRQKLLDRVGLTPEMMGMFYETTKENPDALATWDSRDYAQFTNAVLDLAELLKVPDARTAKEWRQARDQSQEMYTELDRRYPQAQAQQGTYFDIKANKGEEAAREYLQTTTLPEYWQALNTSLLERPMVLKYYQEPGKVDTIAESLAYEELEKRHPDLSQLRQQYAEIPGDNFQARREFRRLHPEVMTAYDEQKELIKQFREELTSTRQLTQEGQQVPGTIDYIIKGQPNATQRGILNTIKELEYEATKPVPLPVEEPGKFTPQQQAAYRAQDAAYAQAVQQFPQLPDWEREYHQIRQVYGKDAANMWAKQTGLFQARDVMTMSELANPVVVQQMKDTDLDWASKVVVRQQAQQMWPGIDQTLDQYFALPEGSKARKQFKKQHPEIGAYYQYKGEAEKFYRAQLYQHRAQLLTQ